MAEISCQNDVEMRVKKSETCGEASNCQAVRSNSGDGLSSNNRNQESVGIDNPPTSSGNVLQVNVFPSNKKNIQERESFQRINYLLQAAQLMIAQTHKARSIPTYYCSLIHSIAQKSLIRLHPDVKRMMCRGCKCLLLPGINAQVSVKPRPTCQVVWKCFLCGTLRRLPAKRGYQLWVQKPEALVLP